MKAKGQIQKESEVRAAKWRALSPQEQLAVLDERLGKGKGASKQRARIAALLPAPKIEPVKVEVEKVLTPKAKTNIANGRVFIQPTKVKSSRR